MLPPTHKKPPTSGKSGVFLGGVTNDNKFIIVPLNYTVSLAKSFILFYRAQLSLFGYYLFLDFSDVFPDVVCDGGFLLS